MMDLLGAIWNYRLLSVGAGSLTPGLIAVAILGFASVFVAAGLIARYPLRRALARTQLDSGSQYSMSRIIYYVMVTFGLLLVLNLVGVELSSLAFLGALVGVGIGFGLQNIAQNFISGILLLIERPIRVGDIVSTGDTVGRVVEIGIRVTQVLTFDNIVIYVPNGEFINEKVINWTAGGRFRATIAVGVSYDDDPDEVQRVLLEVARRTEGVIDDPAPQVRFIGFGDSSLDFELLVWVQSPDPQYRVETASRIRHAIVRAFREHGIEIPFPQRDVHVRTAGTFSSE